MAERSGTNIVHVGRKRDIDTQLLPEVRGHSEFVYGCYGYVANSCVWGNLDIVNFNVVCIKVPPIPKLILIITISIH